jgi:hypothetical protein
MTKGDRLNLISVKMQALIDSQDLETAHVEADMLLKDALRCLAKGTKREGSINQLINFYDDLEKWYA